ncbi:MAG: hypothetical protein ACLFR2_00470 [Candidatus Kapaibacterium sp.]
MKKTLIFLLYFVCAMYAFLLGVRQPNIDGYDKARFGDMVHGEAHRPYVYRALMPAVILSIEKALPDSAEQNIKSLIAKIYPFEKVIDKMGWNQEYYIEYLIGLILMFACLMAFMYTISYLSRGLFKSGGFAHHLIAVASILLLPVMFRYYIYPYDFPTLLLFTLALAMLARGRFKAYIIVFILASINKETAILLPMLWMIYFRHSRKQDPKKYWISAGLQLGIFLVIRSIIMLIYMNNPGVPAEFNFFEFNFPYLFSPHSVPGVMSFIMLVILLFYRWKEKPKFLREALFMGIPLLALAIFWGVIDELRIFYEIYPVLVLLATHTIAGLTGYRLENRMANRL